MLSKVVSKEEALTKIHDGQTIMFGDWHGEFAADEIIDGMLEKGIKDIHAIAVSAGMPDQGVGKLIREKRVKSLVTTHIALNPLARDQMFAGELDIEFCPQGTWSERIRCGGAGLGGVLTPVGIDTLVEESPFCLGRRTIEGKDYLLMKPIHADFALLGTYKCDEFGNCWYKGTMRNFNVVMATAADTVIAETEYLVPVGEIEPENIHTYGMCVDYIVEGERK